MFWIIRTHPFPALSQILEGTLYTDVWVRVSISGSQTAPKGSPTCLPGDPWIHFEVYLFFN
jgi:hypothetical protein